MQKKTRYVGRRNGPTTSIGGRRVLINNTSHRQKDLYPFILQHGAHQIHFPVNVSRSSSLLDYYRCSSFRKREHRQPLTWLPQDLTGHLSRSTQGDQHAIKATTDAIGVRSWLYMLCILKRRRNKKEAHANSRLMAVRSVASR